MERNYRKSKQLVVLLLEKCVEAQSVGDVDLVESFFEKAYSSLVGSDYLEKSRREKELFNSGNIDESCKLQQELYEEYFTGLRTENEFQKLFEAINLYNNWVDSMLHVDEDSEAEKWVSQLKRTIHELKESPNNRLHEDT